MTFDERYIIEDRYCGSHQKDYGLDSSWIILKFPLLKQYGGKFEQ